MSQVGSVRSSDEVTSPCIDVCALDDDGFCLGCLRSMDEITAWPHLDNSGRQRMLTELDRRRAGLDNGEAPEALSSDARTALVIARETP